MQKLILAIKRSIFFVLSLAIVFSSVSNPVNAQIQLQNHGSIPVTDGTECRGVTTTGQFYISKWYINAAREAICAVNPEGPSDIIPTTTTDTCKMRTGGGMTTCYQGNAIDYGGIEVCSQATNPDGTFIVLPNCN